MYTKSSCCIHKQYLTSINKLYLNKAGKTLKTTKNIAHSSYIISEVTIFTQSLTPPSRAFLVVVGKEQMCTGSCLMCHFHPCTLTTTCYMTPSVFKKALAAHSSMLAWKILWMEEPGRLQSMGVFKVAVN